MLNSDIYSSVLTGHKLIVVVCDNGGFAVINRLQNFKGSASFNNLLDDCRTQNDVRVDFARHAESMGAIAETVAGIGELEQAFDRAKAADRTYVIVIKTHPAEWTPGDAWWDVGVPEVSERAAVRAAPSERTRALLQKMAPALAKLPNRIQITGHTDSTRIYARDGYSQWDLSSDRANTTRRILEEHGVPHDRFYAVAGKADTEPLFPDDTFLAANRRVSILIMAEDPPLPHDHRP